MNTLALALETSSYYTYKAEKPNNSDILLELIIKISHDGGNLSTTQSPLDDIILLSVITLSQILKRKRKCYPHSSSSGHIPTVSPLVPATIPVAKVTKLATT